MSQEYMLKLSSKQLGLIARCCELYARIHMGQLASVADVNWDNPNFLELKQKLEELEPLASGMHKNAYPGIHNEKVSDDARVAFDIHHVIMHQLWHDKPDEDKYTCVFSFEPYQISKIEKLPQCSLQKES